MQQFLSFYKNLNSQQKVAVDTIEGPVMVVAGPGTGKTQILTLRIANILKKTQVEPSNILALSFTISGVASIRKRLAEIIGSPAYDVTINTFHGFCNGIIESYPEEFPHIIGAKHIGEADQAGIIEKIVDGLKLKELKPFGDAFYFVRSIISAIDNLKREGIDPIGFEKITRKEERNFKLIEDLCHEKGAHKGKMKSQYRRLLKIISKNKELAVVYAEYQEELKSSKLYDYSDMIMETLRALSKNKNLLLDLQERYQYILVDEHQDTNNAQNKILELIANFHDNPNIFIVGDEKQAIFRFQGASLENFRYFKNLYPGARLIVLENNYRSGQNILDVSHKIIASHKKLKANSKYKNEKIKVCSFSTCDVEDYFIAEDIKEKLSKNIKAEEIAVLYRDNKDAFSVAKALDRAGIPYRIESEQDILSDNDIKKLLVIFRAINNFGSEKDFTEMLHVDFLRVNPLDLYKLMNSSRKDKCSIYSLIKSESVLRAIGVEDIEKINEVYRYFTNWRITAKNKNLIELFEEVINNSGALQHFLKGEGNVDKMDKLNSFFAEVKSLLEIHPNYGLEDFIKYIDILTLHNLKIKRGSTIDISGRVRLMTAHSSKGQEFEYVYIVNVFNGHWGNRRRSGLINLPGSVFSLSGKDIAEDDNDADERRLFFVALTRAKKSVILTYAVQSSSGREVLPAKFIEEIRSKLVDFCDTKQIEKDFKKSQDIVFSPGISPKVDVRDKEFIKSIFSERGFPVTALNNYLKCPWEYFYKNLLRIPEAQEPYQAFGTSIHAALKDFFDKFKTKIPTKSYLLARFKNYISNQQVISKNLEEWQERGFSVLNGYYDNYKKLWRANPISEFSINGIMLTPDIRLTGKIDKIEILNDKQECNVVDYKTGSPKSRNIIEGNTKSFLRSGQYKPRGEIKRQLVFYNLLLNKYAAGKKFKMISGDIDFIEPDNKGRYRKETFIINKVEISELEDLIKHVADEILSLKFWDKRCDDKNCKYCGLRDIM